LLGSDREGLGIVIADLNQIADLKLSILAPVNSDRQSEPNTVHDVNPFNVDPKKTQAPKLFCSSLSGVIL